MEETGKYQKLYALLGSNIDYSRSRNYFKDFFKANNIDDSFYFNFDTQSLDNFPDFLKSYPNLKGMNVTIPYKEEILKFTTSLDEHSSFIGAANVLKIHNNELIGYNTDFYGFWKSISCHINPCVHSKALILGTGGAAKAVAYAFLKNGIEYIFVSTSKKGRNIISYSDLDDSVIGSYKTIVNCTPLGSANKENYFPDIPYNSIGQNHLLFDLIYFPSQTLFLKKGKEMGATTVNGSDMLNHQAYASYFIWSGQGSMKDWNLQIEK